MSLVIQGVQLDHLLGDRLGLLVGGVWHAVGLGEALQLLLELRHLVELDLHVVLEFLQLDFSSSITTSTTTTTTTQRRIKANEDRSLSACLVFLCIRLA